MGQLNLKNITKSFGTVDVIHGIDLGSTTASSSRWSAPRAAASPRCCGSSPASRTPPPAISSSTASASTLTAPADREIAMVFQSYALYPHLSVRENLSFGLENLRMDRAEIAARVAEAARMLELGPYLDRSPALSGGQRQRVAIGRAIVRHPRVFLFDEPLSNLDAALRVQTRGEIARLHRALGPPWST